MPESIINQQVFSTEDGSSVVINVDDIMMSSLTDCVGIQLQRLEKKAGNPAAPNTSSTVGTVQHPTSMPAVSRRKADTAAGMAAQHSNGNTPPGKRAASEAIQREKERKGGRGRERRREREGG